MAGQKPACAKTSSIREAFPSKPSPRRAEIEKHLARLERERAALEHRAALVEVEELGIKGLSRERLRLLTEDVLRVGSDADGTLVLDGEKALYNNGCHRFPKAIPATWKLAQALFELADGKPAKISKSDAKRLASILQAHRPTMTAERVKNGTLRLSTELAGCEVRVKRAAKCRRLVVNQGS